MYNTHQKQEIVQALQAKMTRLGMSQNQVADIQLGLSPASLSNMINGKWKSISDKLWLLAAIWSGYESGWQLAEIYNTKKIYTICQDAQTQSKALGISYEPGSGKSAALRYYAANHKNVYYVECEEYLTKRGFLQQVAAAIGLEVNRSVSDLVEEIIKTLNRLESPLLLIDEADKLRDGALQFFKTFYNKLERRCGFVLCGAPYFSNRILSGCKANKQAYKEIYSRLGGEFIPLRKITNKDIELICRVNKLTHPAAIARVQDNCTQSDLRQVRNLVEQELALAEAF